MKNLDLAFVLKNRGGQMFVLLRAVLLAMCLLVELSSMKAQGLMLAFEQFTYPDLSIPLNYSAVGCPSCAVPCNRLRFKISNDGLSPISGPLHFSLALPNVIVRDVVPTDPAGLIGISGINVNNDVQIVFVSGGQWVVDITMLNNSQFEDGENIMIDLLVDVQCGIILQGNDDSPYTFNASFSYYLGDLWPHALQALGNMDLNVAYPRVNASASAQLLVNQPPVENPLANLNYVDPTNNNNVAFPYPGPLSPATLDENVHTYSSAQNNHIYKRIELTSFGVDVDLALSHSRIRIHDNVNLESQNQSSARGIHISAIYWQDVSNNWFRIVDPTPPLGAAHAPVVGITDVVVIPGFLDFVRTEPNNNVTLSDLYVEMDADVYQLITGNTIIGTQDNIWFEYWLPDGRDLCGEALGSDNYCEVFVPEGPNQLLGTCLPYFESQSEFYFRNTTANPMAGPSGMVRLPNPPNVTDPCYNVQGSNTQKRLYYMVITDATATDNIGNISLSLGYDPVRYPGEITRYDLDPNQNVANQVFAYVVPAGFDPLAANQAFPLAPQPNITQITAPDLSIVNTGPSAFVATNALDFHTILINGLVLPGNSKLVVYWYGHDELPATANCGTIWKDMHNWRIGFQNGCSLLNRFRGAVIQHQFGTWSSTSDHDNFVVQDLDIRTPLVGIGGRSINGPNAFNIVGDPNDDYGNGAPRTAVYVFPSLNVNNHEFLPYDETHTDLIVRFTMDHRLNIWQGDINNVMHMATGAVFVNSDHYRNDHLRRNIRFFINNLPASPNCLDNVIGYTDLVDFDQIFPTEIGYTGALVGPDLANNNAYLGGNYASDGTNLYPTGNNCANDEIVAIFRLNSDDAIEALSGLRMEVDLEPVCSSISQNYCPIVVPALNFNGQADMAAQLLISPSRGCDANAVGPVNATNEPLSSCGGACASPALPLLSQCTVLSPENMYPFACNNRRLTVQCPGCHLTGLYNEGFDVRRISYGLADNDGNHVADNQTRIEFNQKEFWPEINGQQLRNVSSNQVMYGDLFRLRVTSAVHLDETWLGGGFSPTALTLDNHAPGLLPVAQNGHHGFNHCYLRVNVLRGRGNFVEAFGYTEDPLTATMNNSIANVLVWFPNTPGLEEKPVSLFWDYHLPVPATQWNDWVEDTYLYDGRTINEYVFDLTMDRIQEAFATQYPGVAFPLEYYMDHTEMDFDVTFRLVENAVGLAPPNNNLLEFDTRAYFTLIPEAEGDYPNFIDLQDVTELTGQTPIFESQEAMEDLPCYLSQVPTPINPCTPTRLGVNWPNFYPNTLLDQMNPGPDRDLLGRIRWWCVRGEGAISMVGHEHRFGDFREDRGEQTEIPYCGFTLTNSTLDNSASRLFRLRNGGQYIDFPFEFRNPSRLHQITFSPPLPPPHDFSPVSLVVTQPNSGYATNNPTGVNNLLTGTTFNIGAITQDANIALNNTQIFRLDDPNPEENEVTIDFEYNTCGDVPTSFQVCLAETDAFDLLDLGQGINPNPAYTHHYIGRYADPTYDIANLGPDCSPPSNAGPTLTTSVQGSFSLPFLDAAPELRTKTEIFDLVHPGTGHLTIDPNDIDAPLLNVAGTEVIWTVPVFNQGIVNNIPVGDAPNAWVLLRLPDVLDPIDIGIKINGVIMDDVLTFAGGAGNHYLLYYSGIPPNNPSRVWRSYDGGLAFENRVEIVLPYTCGNVYTGNLIPEITVGFSCHPEEFEANTIADVTDVLNYSCDHYGPVSLPQDYPGPALGVSLLGVNSPLNGDFICDPTTIRVRVTNSGHLCLSDLQAEVSTAAPNDPFGIQDGSYSVDGFPFLFNNPPGPLNYYELPTIFPLANPNYVNDPNIPCPNGLNGDLSGGPEEGFLNIDVLKNCHLSYNENDLLDIRIDGNYCPSADNHFSTIHINPYLDNPSSTFNNFGMSMPNYTVSLNDGCDFLPLEIQLGNLLADVDAPGHGSIGEATVGPDNLLVISLPPGLTVTGGTLSDGAVTDPIIPLNGPPLTNAANIAMLESTMTDCDLNNTNLLHYISLPAGASTDNLTLSLDIAIEVAGPPVCTASVCAAMFTLRAVDCIPGAPVECEIFALQNPTSIDHPSVLQATLIVTPPVPMLTVTGPNCGPYHIEPSVDCGYTWLTIDNDPIHVASADVLTGSSTIHAYGSFWPVEGCVSPFEETFTVVELDVEINGVPSYCDGSATILIASGGVSYEWSNFENTAGITVDQPGIYSVTITDVNGCTASAAVTVTENSTPTIDIAGNLVICTGDNTTLTASGASTYVWSTGEVTDAIVVNADGTYTVTGTDANGCSATTSVTVIENPTPTISIAGNLVICTDDNTTLTASGATSYGWSTGGNTDAVTVNAGGVYTVTGTNANGCTSSVSVSVTANSVPTVGISGTLNICDGQTTTLTATGAGTYAWSTGAATESITASTSGTYTVTGTLNGCSATTSVTVTVNPIPTVSISGDNTICPAQTNILTADGANTYLWSTGATATSISAVATGTYTVTGTDANGCSASATFAIGSGVGCCDPSQYTRILIVPHGTYLSQLTGVSLPNGSNQGANAAGLNKQLIIVEGDFFIDKVYTFNNTMFFCQALAHIIVERPTNATASLTLTNSHLRGCEDLWRGISVMNSFYGDHRIIARNTIIEDALVAVEMSGVIFHMHQCTLRNNFIGVYFHDCVTNNPYVEFNNPNSSPGPTIIETTRDLFPNLTGNWALPGLPPPSKRAWAGIYAFHMTTLNHLLVKRCEFRMLNKGIGFISSTGLKVERCTFTDIRGFPAGPLGGYTYATDADWPSCEELEGCAVFAYKCNKPLVVHRESNIDNLFNHCDYAVTSWKMSLEATYNHIDDVKRGVTGGLMASGATTISSNEMTNVQEYGVYCFELSGNSDATIADNHITMDAAAPDPAGNYPGKAINVELEFPGAVVRAINNTITLDKAYAGIYSNYIKGIYLERNTISMTELTNLTLAEQPAVRLGIALILSPEATLNCNHISFDGSVKDAADPTLLNPYAAGTLSIFALSSPRCIFHKNTTDDTEDGMDFMAPCEDAVLSGNEFGFHNRGLRLFTTAIIGDDQNTPTQGNLSHQSNTWQAGQNGQQAYLIAGAVHESFDQQTVRRSTFEVHENYNPIGTFYHPTIFSYGGWGGNSDFFLQTVPPPSCPLPPCAVDQACNQNQPQAVNFNGIDYSTAEGIINFEIYPEGLNYTLDRFLYARLIGDTSQETLNNPIFQQFLQDSASTAVGFYASLDNALQQAAQQTENETGKLYAIKISMDSLESLISVAQSSIENHSPDSLALAAQIEVWSAQHAVYYDSLMVLNDTIDARLQAEAAAQSLLNKSFGANEVYEQNEQAVDSIFLKRLSGATSYAYSANENAILESVANQCPLAGGPAVFRARALLGLDHPTVYNDRDLCLTAGILIRGQAPEPENSMTLYPNPGDGTQLTLSFEKPLAQETLVEVFDTKGLPWKNFVLNAKTKTQTLKIEELPAGLYIFKTHDAAGLNFIARYLLIK